MSASAFEHAVLVLTTADPAAKAGAAQAAFEAVRSRKIQLEGMAAGAAAPKRPARPNRPRLAPPAEVPRRRLGSTEGRIALIHALAHIEFNAIDLAFDMALRFAPEVAQSGLDARRFMIDWFAVGADEARHFLMLDHRLRDLGSSYGELSAHDGLWEAAQNTADSVLARLAVAPMALEARGLDVTPAMAHKLRRAGDEETARLLDQIYADEHGHVATGVRWFEAACQARNLEPVGEFKRLIRECLTGSLKPPYNEPARSAAGMASAYYLDWNASCGAEP